MKLIPMLSVTYVVTLLAVTYGGPMRDLQSVIFFVCILTSAQMYGAEFHPATTFETNQRQHGHLPASDIWWTVYGKDQHWNFRNLHQILPTVNVYRDGEIHHLEQALNPDIGAHPISTPDGPLPFNQFITSDYSTATGVIILHKGKIAFEAYPRMQPYEMPIYWSVSKVLTGLLIRILEERGKIDVSKPIEKYLPELSTSALKGTTVRNLLDMATGLDCADDYEDKSSCYYRYSIAIGDGYWQVGDPKDPYVYVSQLKADRLHPQGQHFSYSSLNTFVLSWLVEKVTGLSFQDAFTREVWWKIGAEANASFIAPHQGVALAHGGFLARLRDLARFGLIYTPSYDGPAIVHPEHLKLLLTQGRRQLLENAGVKRPGVRHNIYQWDAVLDDDTLFKGGWAGQGLLINPRLDVVAVFTGYYKEDQSEIPLGPQILNLIKTVYADKP